MISKTTKSRLAYKLDKLFWVFVMVLPFVVYLGSTACVKQPDFLVWFKTFSPFPYVAEIFDKVFETSFNATFPISDYLAYCVGVEILHLMFDVVVFIPRIAHKWIEKAVQDD